MVGRWWGEEWEGGGEEGWEGDGERGGEETGSRACTDSTLP